MSLLSFLLRKPRRIEAPLIVMTFDEFAALNEEPAPDDEPETAPREVLPVEPQYPASHRSIDYWEKVDPTTQRFHPLGLRGPLYTDVRWANRTGGAR